MDLTENSEHLQALQLLDAMRRLQTVWVRMHPKPPLRRSDLILLVTVQNLAGKGPGPHKPKGEEAVSMGALARALKQTPPGISQKVGEMEKQGYLKRTVSLKDRRNFYVELTPKGEDICEKTLMAFIVQIEAATGKLGEEQTNQFISLLNAAIAAFEGTLEECTQKEDICTC